MVLTYIFIPYILCDNLLHGILISRSSKPSILLATEADRNATDQPNTQACGGQVPDHMVLLIVGQWEHDGQGEAGQPDVPEVLAVHLGLDT